MQIICFEDDRVEQLRPITHARPAYAIACASFRLIDWISKINGSLHGHVRPFLYDIQSLDYSLGAVPTTWDDPDGILLVNARLVPCPALDVRLLTIANQSMPSVVIDEVDDSILVARIPRDPMQNLQLSSIGDLLESARSFRSAGQSFAVFRWPHDTVAQHMTLMNEAMEYRIANDNWDQLVDGVFVRPGQTIGDQISIDVTDGPIILESDVKIGPFTHLSGPIYAGARTRVAEHASIKDRVALGHTVKVGGEIESSIIEPFTNKQHHGFLGHSYLGSWINLGAGTCNSDLKNTYGNINVQYGEDRINSTMQFLGCFIGDYSKTAINTSIFTGKAIGVCSMLYGFVTTNVPSFVNYGRTFGQTSQLPADVMITTQQRMFARRNVRQRECDQQLIRDMYARTTAERDTAEFEIL